MRYLIHETKGGRETVRWANDHEKEMIEGGRDPVTWGSLDENTKRVDVVMTYGQYVRFKRDVETWKRRIEGMQEAVRRWREKAGVDPPLSEPELVMAERKLVRVKGKQEWWYYEHRTIPVEKSPHLAREAWEWLERTGKAEYVERIYFHEKHGWIAVLRVEW